MEYAYIIPIVAGVVLVVAGGYGIKSMSNCKSEFKVPNPYNDDYLRYMEDELNRRSSDSRRTFIAGRRTKRKK
jgi:hypothetical protein